MTPIVSSTFDIAHWFLRRGELSRTFVSPLKLQRLLYLTQAYYAGRHGGRPLMPSLFVVSEVGPLEPNIHRAIEHEAPKVSVRELPEEIMEFVETIWQKYGTQRIDDLNRLIMRDPAFTETEARGGVQAIIGLDAMRRHHAPQENATPSHEVAEKPPGEIPDFIAAIISAARDEAGATERGGSGVPDGGKRLAAWIPGPSASTPS